MQSTIQSTNHSINQSSACTRRWNCYSKEGCNGYTPKQRHLLQSIGKRTRPVPRQLQGSLKTALCLSSTYDIQLKPLQRLRTLLQHTNCDSFRHSRNTYLNPSSFSERSRARVQRDCWSANPDRLRVQGLNVHTTSLTTSILG